jgi:hypothetical protein
MTLVRDLIAELSKVDPDAIVVQVSGIGWPTFLPIQFTASIRIKSADMKFPYCYEKVDDLDQPSIKAVVIY